MYLSYKERVNSNYDDFMILLGNIFLVLVSGLLLSLAVVALIYLLLRGLHRSYYPTPMGLIVFFALFVVLFFEGAFMTGAIYAKGYVKDVQHFIETNYIKDKPNNHDGAYHITNEAVKEIEDQFPALESYTSYIKNDNNNIIFKIDSARRWFSRYIVKRVAAIVIISVIGGFLAGVFRRKTRSTCSNIDYEMYDG